jgi:hypothetical protein
VFLLLPFVDTASGNNLALLTEACAGQVGYILLDIQISV